jgi:opacity protein-like surface antigen
MRGSTRLVVILALFALFPLSAFAQDEARFHSVGAHFGGELDDNDDSWIVLGLDARVILGFRDLEVNPRFTFRPFNGGSASQIDVNILQNYVLANPGRFRPFVGAGGAIRHTAFDASDGETNVGLNLLSGTRLVLSHDAQYEPFALGQYTIINDERNAFTIIIGVSFNLR